MRETVKLGVRLMLFALVAGLLLAVVNAITEEPIARNERLKTDGARIAVIGDYALAITGRASIASSPLATSFTVTIFVMQSTSGCVCCTCAKICAKGARSSIERNVCAMGRPPSL